MISICVRGLDKSYRARAGNVPALAGININVRDGEFVIDRRPFGMR